MTDSPEGAAEPIRVLVADDHPVYRDGLRILFQTVDGIDVVATAASGSEAVERCGEVLPDVVVMDLHMPGLNGIEATRAIATEFPTVAVLVLTMHDDDESVFNAMQAGARGYLLKGADQADIERAIRAVVRGEAIFGPALARRIAHYFSGGGPSAPARTAGDGSPLTERLTARERDVLELVARGRNNAAIAAELFLSEKTIRNNISAIFMKLQVADRAEAIVRAREAGLGGR